MARCRPNSRAGSRWANSPGLRIVADEVRERGFCALTLGAIAAHAGCCRELAKRAVRKAAREELMTVEERRRPGQVNLPNVIRIISREWLAWIARGPRPSSKGIGEAKLPPCIQGQKIRVSGRRERHP